jgi:hypothetical protein
MNKTKHGRIAPFCERRTGRYNPQESVGNVYCVDIQGNRRLVLYLRIYLGEMKNDHSIQPGYRRALWLRENMDLVY